MTTKKQSSDVALKDAPAPPEEEQEAPAIVATTEEDGSSNVVRVSVVSSLPGHRFVIPYSDDPSDALVIDGEGVYVDRSAVEAIQEAAQRSGVTVKVEEL